MNQTQSDGIPDVEVRSSGHHSNSETNQEAPRAIQDTPGIDTDRLLVHGAKQIIRLFVPVSVCMLMVVSITAAIPYYTRAEGYLIYTPFHTETEDTGTIVWENLVNACIFFGMLVVFTIILVLLYKYRCTKVIYGWVAFTSVFVLFFFCLIFLEAIFEAMNIYMDWITVIFLMWNFGLIGMLSLFWKAPLIIQQVSLLLISSQVALIFIKYFPFWTTWFLLGLLAVWDLIAVLCPKGPLRILVELAQERDEELMPVMIYSTTAAMMADIPRSADKPPDEVPAPSTNTDLEAEVDTTGIEDDEDEVEMDEEEIQSDALNDERARQTLLNHNQAESNNSAETHQASTPRARAAVLALNGADNSKESRTARNLRDIQEEVLSREDRGVKLGLGDFVFYSVLVGTASKMKDWNTTLACYVAILIGMCSTLLLLAIRGHALPALPISIFFGVVFYFCTNLIITPFTSLLAENQVFI